MGKKKSTCLYLDPKIVETARKLGLNVSKVSENALIQAIGRLGGMEQETGLYSQDDPEGRDRDSNPGGGLHRPTKENLSHFADFLAVDLQLSGATVKEHMYEAKRFLAWLREQGVSLGGVSRVTVRGYLKRFEGRSSSTYANVLKSLKRFLRDFNQRPGLVSSFKFPERHYAPKAIPSKQELRKFYAALEKPIERALFLFYATTGLRKNEVLSLSINDIDFKERMVVPRNGQTRTKRRWASFFNHETETALREYLATRKDGKPRLFRIGTHTFVDFWKRAYSKTGVHVTPKVLRTWFCDEMGRLGVPDRYVDAFCGRIPKSVLAKSYTDFSALKLQEIYNKAGLVAFN